jgi:hypothetical protein
MFVYQKENPHKPPAKVKRTREEMQTTLEKRKKVAIDFPRSALKKKNRVEEGGTSCSRVRREQESTNLRAQKMIRGIAEPFAMPMVVKTMPIVVHIVKHVTKIPQMTSP